MTRLILTAVIALLPLFTASRAQDKPAELRKLTSGGRERTYHLHVPPSFDRARPAPLLFVFHGAGGNGLSDLGAYRWLADRDGFLLVGPDGFNKRWNAGNSDELKATDSVDDVTFVRDMVKAVGSDFKVDASRVYAAGFSNGAALCHRLAADAPDVFSAVAGTGATMPKVTQPLLKPGAYISVQIMVGTGDGMFGRKGDLRGGTFLTAEETANVWAKHNACIEPAPQSEPVAFTRWPARSPATGEVELWIVEGAGHTPSPGGNVWNAAEQQWKFLSRHRRAAAGAAFTVYTKWPFDWEEAQRRQRETANAMKMPVTLRTPLSGTDGPDIAWLLIPAGKFVMGSPESEDGHEGDERQHEETIAEPFYMMETQLTAGQYRTLMHAEPAEGGYDHLPAGIPYRDTVDKVLPALAKLAPAGWKVILPDHPRLEYAARAGIATMNPGGNKPEDGLPFSWSRENSRGKVHPVKQKGGNAWSLQDVTGNRWHWFWRAGAGYGNDSTDDHIVYGGSYNSESGGNGVRLANIMISHGPEGARFALIRADSTVPKGHPETANTAPGFPGSRAGDGREVAGLKLCWCPPGKFSMGSPPGERDRRPDETQVEVTLTKGFWMGKYEVTQSQWKKVAGEIPGKLIAGEGDDFPVYWVSFIAAEDFCRKLTEQARASGELPAAWEFRLPTEAQWEYACRAGTTTAFSCGDRLTGKEASMGKPYDGTPDGTPGTAAARVGSYPANPWGLHDMHGNEFELCRDWYHDKLPGGTDPDLSDRKGVANRDGTFSRVRRGGAWNDEEKFCRSAFRLRYEPERNADHIGFRVVVVQP